METVKDAQRWLRKAYPALFGRDWRPIGIGVGVVILADPRRPATISRNAVRTAMRMRCRHDRYLMALTRPGACRFDAAGKAAGQVDAAHAESAKRTLNERKSARRAKKKPQRGAGAGQGWARPKSAA